VPFSGSWSAVVVEGGDTGESGELCAVGVAEFGEVDEECGGGDGSDAWDGLEEFGLVVGVVVLADVIGDVFVDLVDEAVEVFEESLDAECVLGGGGGFEVLEFEGAEFDELSSAEDEGLELSEVFRCFLKFTEGGSAGEADEGSCVDAVGFGEDALGPGEADDTVGLDDGDAVSVLEEVVGEVEVVSSCGFHDDDAFAGYGEELVELEEAFGGVWE